MRILLVSDIHGNRPALEALRETYDICLCLGDLVDYGGSPATAVDWVRTNATHCVRGNHDHGAAHDVAVTGGIGFKYLSGVTRPLTRERLAPTDLRFLADLPVTRFLTLDGLKFLLVHATPRDPLDEFAPPDPEFWARRLEGIEADVICVGHTHVQYALEVNGKLVLNPGSLGLPRDGDPRAGYAILENRNVQLRRYEYPIDDAIAEIEATSIPDKAKAMLATVYRTGTLPRTSNGNGHVNGHIG
ncbi:MAG: metallophosphoesterase family protein [Gemmataceae bacterium]